MTSGHATRAVAADDGQAAGRLEEVFARHQAELLGTLYFLVGNREDARDALQETFVKCWRRRDLLPGVENLRAWVFRVAVNTARDLRSTAWRKRRVPLPGDESVIASDARGPDAELLDRERLDRLRCAVTELRPQEQEVFLLRQNGAMTYEQIAQAIDVPLGTVKTRMRLALARLRAALEAEA